MRRPEIVECFPDNGEAPYWELLDSETREVLWSEKSEELERPRGILIVGGPSMKITELIGAQLRLMREMSEIPTEYHHGTASPEFVEALNQASVDWVKSQMRQPLLSEPMLIERLNVEYADFILETKVPYGPSKNKVLNLNTKQNVKSNRNLRATCIRKIPRNRKSN